jgi:UDP-N-acetylglucosamine:LPS N-acetylglucosamine transferase
MAENTTVLIGIGGGGFMLQAYNLLSKCPPEVELILFAPEVVRERLKEVLTNRHYTFLDPPRVLKQRRRSGLLDNMMCLLVGTWYSVKVIKEYQPAVVLSVGQRVSVYLMAAAKITGVKGYFIECITRVSQQSSTGRIIDLLKLADKIFVQWPEGEKVYQNAIYRGRLV